MKRAIIILALLTACQAQESELIAKAKEAAASRMKDPSSAQFSEVEECDKPGMVMGKINAKNGFGAYTGVSPFLYENGRAWLVEDLGLDEFMINVDRCLGQKPGSLDDSVNNLINATDTD